MIPVRAATRRAWLRYAVTALMLGLVLSCAVGTASARADVAVWQWQPTASDLIRTARPCPEEVDAASAAVCWSVKEDLSAWMALAPGSGYPWGQCTYYVGLMRSDIWNDRAPPTLDQPDNWDAWTWAEHGQAEGLTVDGSPRPRDVMVYSRRAAGNNTGHLAIVDSVGGPDRRTSDLLVTVSEMNAGGLDDPNKGQGDTLTLQLSRSELVPGMIQFIHEPAPGYVAPVWQAGTGDPPPGATAASATGSPSLAVGVYGNQLGTVSQSTAPELAVVTSLATGRTVSTLHLTANRVVALRLAGGRYRVCVSQAATGRWAAASGCATGSWRAALSSRRSVSSSRRPMSSRRPAGRASRRPQDR
jgi:surface antigen